MSSVDATSFPDVEEVLAKAIRQALTGVYASNTTPVPTSGRTVIVGFSGGGYRDWAEAAVNVGINVCADTESDCRQLVADVQNFLATLSDDNVSRVAVPPGAASVPRQTPPFQRYFAATVYLRGQAVL
jgi:hypothetical protein